MPKTKQIDLKRKFKAELTELLTAVRLKCGDCLGYFVDDYEPCSDEHCPLLKFYPTRNLAKRSRKFKQEMINLAKARGNNRSYIAEIGRDEAE